MSQRYIILMYSCRHVIQCDGTIFVLASIPVSRPSVSSSSATQTRPSTRIVARPADSTDDDELLINIQEEEWMKEFYAQKAAARRAVRDASVVVTAQTTKGQRITGTTEGLSSPARLRSTRGLGPRLQYEEPASLPMTVTTDVTSQFRKCTTFLLPPCQMVLR